MKLPWRKKRKGFVLSGRPTRIYADSPQHGERITKEQAMDAVRVLAQLVHDEYPADLMLVDIALRWGNRVSDRQMAALDAVERAL